MPTQINSYLSKDDAILYTDTLASQFKICFASFGKNDPLESTTFSAKMASARNKILGDGTTSFPGIRNPTLKAYTKGDLNNITQFFRYDTFFRRGLRGLITGLDSIVLATLPAWNFATGGNVHAFDAYLLRQNAAHTGVPTTPVSAGTLTAIQNSSGMLPNCTSGNCPRIVHTLVGSNDFDESLQSAEAAQVAISNEKNALSYQISGTVPVGVTKVRVYRSLVGGAGGTYFYLKDVAVTTGAAYPAILLTESDMTLRQDINPPSWASCLMTPEFAILFALSNATAQSGQNADSNPAVLRANGMLSPSNVALNPINGFLGVGNVGQSGTFGNMTIGGSYVSGVTQGGNVAPSGIQGFVGSTGIQARVTTILNGTRTPTISYTYFQASTGFGSTQTQTGVAGSAFSGTAVDSIATFTVPAGRIVLSVNETSAAGTATSGVYLFEAVPVRSI